MGQWNSYYTISDLAKELDVKKGHIRFCEENGLIPPRASMLKRRVYNRHDRERLKLVFHFVLIGYSKEQIIDLIGICDANLGEDDQLMQGIEYGLKALKKLEKRKEELSFTKQTRIINEIEMLREYIDKIKIIKSGVLEEPSARPSIRFEEKAKIPAKPVMEITAKAEKKTTQHPVKMISFFVAGLVLVILIGSYFYYQAGQKETKTIKPVQKKPIHLGKFRVPQAPVPVDQTAKLQVVAPEEQKIPESTLPVQMESVKAQSTDVSLDVAKRNGEIPSESDTNLLKDKKPSERQLGAFRTGTFSKDDDRQAGIVEETALSQTSKEIPATAGDALIPEKQKLIRPEVKEAPKVDVQKEVAGEDLSEKAAPAAVSEDSLTAAKPEPDKEKAIDIEVKETSESAAKASPVTDDVSLIPEKEMEQITSEEDINQQKNELSRLTSFLSEYCQAYTNKNLDKFITFFTSDATINNKLFHELLADYRKNMEGMESLTYRIELMSYSKQTDSRNLMIRGRFFTRYQLQKGGWEENNGSIFMELLENKDSFLVKQLNY
ncbi:MAG: MerR family transcriptional regulator [Deltaproteobacteria bacterium]|nr:MerR family transcriptional regulator [Deltaproteobacteria bacterium]